MDAGRKKTIGKLITLGLIAVAGWYCMRDVVKEWDKVSATLQQASWGYVFASLVIGSIGFSMSGWGLAVFYEGYANDTKFSKIQLIGTYLVGNIFRYLPGKIVTPVYIVQVAGLSKVEVTQACLTMLASSLAAGGICAMILTFTVFDSQSTKWLLILGLGACVAFLIPAVNKRIFALLSKPLSKFVDGKMGQIPVGTMIRGVLIMFTGWVLAGFSLAIIVAAFIPMNLEQAAICTVLYQASFCAGFLVLTAPAGLGVREAVIIPVLMQTFVFAPEAETQFAIAFSIALLHRFVVTVSDVLQCGIGWFLQPSKPVVQPEPAA